ncbi:response regulator transcription factor [Sulfuricurvum sp.]|uniref:response regulator transcription factor n=2 Tax=Sulfuricurvum sp. TaxID=2025608 RepID=UPI0026025C5A|nr:response regulator transcription factor [Sulfuricurvum sp.]MDD2265683.1 response regulator transcription factor [Sulfuricurvum sp.]
MIRAVPYRINRNSLNGIKNQRMLQTQTIYEETKRLSVLFVEDDDPIRQRTAEILEDYFYRVDTGIDGIDALEKFNHYFVSKQKYYDLVISDIQMPRMNGVELTAELYAIRPDQPIIILSAHTEAEYLITLLNYGVAQFITKPIQYQEMLDTLHKVCKKINTAITVIPENRHIIALDEDTCWDNEKKKLICRGSDASLTKYEIHLMTLLTSKFEQVCSSDDILHHFYLNNIDVSSDNLRGMMMRLRKKLPENTLSSIYGLGYRLSYSHAKPL